MSNIDSVMFLVILVAMATTIATILVVAFHESHVYDKTMKKRALRREEEMESQWAEYIS